jgi:mRNA-degrading endonuclease RelE of RelBE toxin-antitoxin system
MLSILYSKQASRFLKRAERQMSDRILRRIESLAVVPHPQELQRVTGTGLFRIRVGRVRILYEVDVAANTLGIVKIDKRERVYDRV